MSTRKTTLIYSLPIAVASLAVGMENLKVFEMPVPGYLGFPAFAFECFTMYVLVRALVWRVYAGRRTMRAIAL